MLKYLGKGFIPGVPARDLTEEEAQQYGGRLALIRSGLYKDDHPTRVVNAKAILDGYDNKGIFPATRENKKESE